MTTEEIPEDCNDSDAIGASYVFPGGRTLPPGGRSSTLKTRRALRKRRKDLIEQSWRGAEVFGLWAAAIVGLVAVVSSTRDADLQRNEMEKQITEMRAERQANSKNMEKQIAEMQFQRKTIVSQTRANLIAIDYSSKFKKLVDGIPDDYFILETKVRNIGATDAIRVNIKAKIFATKSLYRDVCAQNYQMSEDDIREEIQNFKFNFDVLLFLDMSRDTQMIEPKADTLLTIGSIPKNIFEHKDLKDVTDLDNRFKEAVFVIGDIEYGDIFENTSATNHTYICGMVMYKKENNSVDFFTLD